MIILSCFPFETPRPHLQRRSRCTDTGSFERLFSSTVGGRELRHLVKLFGAWLPLLCHAVSCRQGLEDALLPGLPGKAWGLTSSLWVCGVPNASGNPEQGHGDSDLFFAGNSCISVKLQKKKLKKKKNDWITRVPAWALVWWPGLFCHRITVRNYCLGILQCWLQAEDIWVMKRGEYTSGPWERVGKTPSMQCLRVPRKLGVGSCVVLEE